MTIAPTEALDVLVETPGGSLIADPGPGPVLNIVVDLPGGVLYAQSPTAGDTPDALRLAIVDVDGVPLVPDVGDRRSLSGGVEDGGSGSVSFTVGVDDFAGQADDLLHPNNRLVVYYGQLAIAEALMDSAPLVQEETGAWVYSIDGRGSLDILDNGVVFPESWYDNDDRTYDYGSSRIPYDGWYVPSQWKVPASKLVTASYRWTVQKRKQPRGWPEKYARWIWSSSPETGSSDGARYFRSEFTVTNPGRVRIWAAGDDTLQLKLDGNVILTVGQGGWRKASSVTMFLGAGNHVMAAKVVNVASETSSNRSGFAFCMGRLDDDGKIAAWILRSNPTRWKVYYQSEPPGWFPPSVLAAQVVEGETRGVTGYQPVGRTFTTVKDSSGRPWTNRHDLAVPVGASATELVDVVRSYGYNVAMLPGLRLCAWISRGRDLRNYVSIGKPATAGWTSRVWARVKTRVLVHAAFGWRDVATTRAGLLDYYGRREMSFTAGNAKTESATTTQGRNALRDVATPEETIDVTTSNTEGPQPFRDYDVADVIMVAVRGGYIPARVKAISFSENTDKTVTWTTTVYPFAVPVEVA